MAPDRRARWKKEIDWLLSVTDHIVEFVPSRQTSKDGTNMEVGIFSPFLLSYKDLLQSGFDNNLPYKCRLW